MNGRPVNNSSWPHAIMGCPWVYLVIRPDGHYGVPLSIGIIPDLGAYIIQYPAHAAGYLTFAAVAK